MNIFSRKYRDIHFAFIQLHEPVYSKLKEEVLRMLGIFERGFEEERDDHNYSVYTGTGGLFSKYYAFPR